MNVQIACIIIDRPWYKIDGVGDNSRNETQSVEELLRTNDVVLISYAASLLDDAGIVHAVFDSNMSIIEGSLGILPRRLMVDTDQISRARYLLGAAGIGDERA